MVHSMCTIIQSFWVEWEIAKHNINDLLTSQDPLLASCQCGKMGNWTTCTVSLQDVMDSVADWLATLMENYKVRDGS